MEEKSQIEIAYYNEFNRDFNEDIRNTFTTEEAVKFIPFFRLSEDISHLDDSLIIDIILSIADAHRKTHRPNDMSIIDYVQKHRQTYH